MRFDTTPRAACPDSGHASLGPSWAVGLLLVAILLAACGPGVDFDQLEPIPHPPLDNMDQPVQEQLRAQRRTLEELRSGSADVQQLADAYGEMGRLYHLYDLVDSAVASYRNAHLLDPRNADWPYYLGMLQRTDGDLQQAVDSFRAVLSLEPDDMPAQLQLGEVLLELGQAAEARTIFAALLDRHPDNAAVHNGLGRTLLDQGETEEALEHLQAALDAQPRAGLVHFSLGEAYRKLGDRERAAYHLDRTGRQPVRYEDPRFLDLTRDARGVSYYLQLGGRALVDGDLQRARQNLERAVREDPENAGARHNLASALTRLGALPAAVEQYQKALALEPDNAVVHYNLGTVLLQLGEVEGALQNLQKALELNPSFDETRFKLIEAQLAADDPDAALATAEDLLRRLPDNPAARRARARAWLAQGHTSRAVSALRSIVADYPSDADAILELGMLIARTGDEAAARQLFERLLDDASLPAPARARAAVELANRQRANGDVASAEAGYRRALELDAALPQAHFYLAGLLGGQGQFLEAATAYRRVIELDPSQRAARLGEANALLLAGDPATARNRLEIALQALPGDPAPALLLTRVMATAPHPPARDPNRAVQLAEALFQARADAATAETLAMAYAAAGRFQEAQAIQERLIAQLQPRDPELTARLDGNLQRYRQSQSAAYPWTPPN